jgi:hypothetical protein
MIPSKSEEIHTPTQIAHDIVQASNRKFQERLF